MAKIFHDSVSVTAPELSQFCERILLACDVPAADARYVTWHLVETNLRGTDSHGVARLPHYVRRLMAGGILAQPKIVFERCAPSLGIVDGGHGLGHVVTVRATDEAAKLATESGAGWVAIRNSSHCGALAPFGLRLAECGMIGIVFTHVDPMVLPYGSRSAFAGTNPICLTAPGKDGKALCLDMATSIVPWNLIANARNEGAPIPQGWAVNRQGENTTDPKAVAALYPFGQHKGSGLGILIDVLCSFLVNAPYGPDIPKMYGENMAEHRQLGGLVGAIDIKRFVPRGEFEARVTEFVTRLGSLPPAAGFDRVRFPGEPELETKRLRLRDGIPVGIETFRELNELAIHVGCEELQPARQPLAPDLVSDGAGGFRSRKRS